MCAKWPQSGGMFCTEVQRWRRRLKMTPGVQATEGDNAIDVRQARSKFRRGWGRRIQPGEASEKDSLSCGCE